MQGLVADSCVCAEGAPLPADRSSPLLEHQLRRPAALTLLSRGSAATRLHPSGSLAGLGGKCLRTRACPICECGRVRWACGLSVPAGSLLQVC